MNISKDEYFEILAELKIVDIKIKKIKKKLSLFDFDYVSNNQEEIEKHKKVLKDLENDKGIILPYKVKQIFGNGYSKIASICGYISKPVWCQKERKTVRVYVYNGD